MLLLVYCSFSVPYSIAFIDSDSSEGLTPIEISDLAIDLIFMIDISLTFVTQYNVKGHLPKNSSRNKQKSNKIWGGCFTVLLSSSESPTGVARSYPMRDYRTRLLSKVAIG